MALHKRLWVHRTFFACAVRVHLRNMYFLSLSGSKMRGRRARSEVVKPSDEHAHSRCVIKAQVWLLDLLSAHHLILINTAWLLLWRRTQKTINVSFWPHLVIFLFIWGKYWEGGWFPFHFSSFLRHVLYYAGFMPRKLFFWINKSIWWKYSHLEICPLYHETICIELVASSGSTLTKKRVPD